MCSFTVLMQQDYPPSTQSKEEWVHYLMIFQLLFFLIITSSFLTFLFVRNGDIEFQKLLLVQGWFSADFVKYCFLAVFVRFVYLFFPYFCFSGAWLCKVDGKMFVKSAYFIPPLHSLAHNLFSNWYKKSLVSKYLKPL